MAFLWDKKGMSGMSLSIGMRVHDKTSKYRDGSTAKPHAPTFTARTNL